VACGKAAARAAEIKGGGGGRTGRVAKKCFKLKNSIQPSINFNLLKQIK
jgi:hypothetical protein